MVMRRGDSSMPSGVLSSKRVLPDKARVSPRRVAPTVAFAGVVARRFESLRGRNSAFELREAGMHVEVLFESMLSESFGGEL